MPFVNEYNSLRRDPFSVEADRPFGSVEPNALIISNIQISIPLILRG